MTFNHTDKDQIAAITGVINKFSGLKIPDSFIVEYNKNFPRELSYENLQNIFSGDYKISVGVKFPEKMDANSIMAFSGSDISSIKGLDIVISGTFSEPDKIDQIITSGLSSKGITPSEEGGYKSWTVLKPQVYIVNKNNLFFVTFSKENKDSAIKRLEEGTGMDKSNMIITSLASLSEKNLGYAYLDLEKLQALSLSTVSQAERDLMKDSPASLYKNIFAVLVAEKDGVKIISKVVFKNNIDLLSKHFPANEISLINKVPGEDLIMYAEMAPTLDATLEELSRMMSGQLKAISVMDKLQENPSLNENVPTDVQDSMAAEVPDYIAPPSLEIPSENPALIITDSPEKIARDDSSLPGKVSRAKPKKEYPKSSLIMPSSSGPEEIKDESVKEDCLEGPSGQKDCTKIPLSFEKPSAVKALDIGSVISSDDFYGSILDQLSQITEVPKADLKGIIASPYAFAMYDNGTFVPGFAIYLRVSDKYKESAKKLISAIASYMDEVIVMLDVLLKEQGGAPGMIKKDVKVVEGAGIQKIYVDWSAVPKNLIEAGSVKARFDISKTKLEFYYGMFNDNVMAFALYPDFVDAYGKDVIANMEYFNDAKSAVKTIYGYEISILKFDTFLSFIIRYMGTFGIGIVPLDTMERITKIVEEFTKIEYIVTSTVKEGQNFLKSVVYIKVGDDVKDMKIETPVAGPEKVSENKDDDKEEIKEVAEGSVPDQSKIYGAEKIAILLEKNLNGNLTGGGCVFKDKVLGPISAILSAGSDDFKNLNIFWTDIKGTAILGTICEGGYTVLVDKSGSKYGVFIKMTDAKYGNMSCSDVKLGVDSTKLVEFPADLGKKEGGDCYVAGL